MWNKTGEGYVCSKTAPPALAKDCAVTKVAVTKCGKSLFTLDSESHLMLWSTHTLTCMRQWNDSVADFSLQETAQETTGVDGLKIVMLTMDQDGACSLQICSLPRLEPVCRLQLNKTAWLVSCPSSQESVLLVEGAAEETSSLGDHGDLIENLKVCCLTETLPETRFYKLLSKKLFDGAESFAKLFNLDVELVYKTKANYILDQLSLWGDSSLSPQADGDLLVQLKLCLVNIQDDGNIVECCIKAPLSNARDVFDLLNFARNRLENSQQVGNGKTLCEVERSDLLTKPSGSQRTPFLSTL
ncbi:hypothetical protein LSAT2_025561 [Lamellibrachia satsuma]|nr:hypothetical protein LSAT2_025561 [Lamellibrachia satsuma]